MNRRAAQEREIRQIAIAANSGGATDEQIARLDELIRSDVSLANYAARMFDQQASLAWQGMAHGRRATAEADACFVPCETIHERIQLGLSAKSNEFRSSPALHLPTIAVAVAFILGALAMPLLSRMSTMGSPEMHAGSQQAAGARPTYEARLVGSTACYWDGNSSGSREVGSWLTSGESLHLLEGLAAFTFNWSVGGHADVSLEGPAAMVLTSEGMPTLRFGRLTATISTVHRPFVLDTPVGRLVVSEYGSIGVSAFGNDAEIHVFDGAVLLESAWPGADQSNVLTRIEAGQAIRIEEGSNGELRVTRHDSDEQYFAAHVSMESDALAIPDTYVAAVKAARPILYWRFERGSWPTVPNEMSDRLAGQVVGMLGKTVHHGNEAVEFGVTDEGGEIVSDDVIENALPSYSLEFWIKPSHYHVGAVVSLVGDEKLPGGANPHGLLCELGGTGKIPRAVHHPGRVRFLHRNPPSNDTLTGTSCYSNAGYTLRKWQHVALVKDESQMRVFIDGQRVGSAEDRTEMAANLRLLVGRLYPSRGVRPFIGQLDELALYDRALTPEEIQQRVRLVRPPTVRGPSS